MKNTPLVVTYTEPGKLLELAKTEPKELPEPGLAVNVIEAVPPQK